MSRAQVQAQVSTEVQLQAQLPDRQDASRQDNPARQQRHAALAALCQRAGWRCDQLQARLARTENALRAAQEECTRGREHLEQENRHYRISSIGCSTTLYQRRLSWLYARQQQLHSLDEKVAALQSRCLALRRHGRQLQQQRELLEQLLLREIAASRQAEQHRLALQADDDWLSRCRQRDMTALAQPGLAWNGLQATREDVP